MKNNLSTPALHSRNWHRNGYDFSVLVQSYPALSQYVRPNAYGDDSIDFANPQAVKALNQALLKHYYGVAVWDISKNYLFPPIGGRQGYVHFSVKIKNNLKIRKYYEKFP